MEERKMRGPTYHLQMPCNIWWILLSLASPFFPFRRRPSLPTYKSKYHSKTIKTIGKPYRL